VSAPWAWKLPPERVVDGARDSRGVERREWCTMLAESPEARCELELMAAFERDGELPRSAEARIAVAIDGALATLDEEV
jgi:hypothetical protein